ncbi:hypothetical protein ACNPQM_25210 [Streptomyces sp. NPDC056231]|uniref:hypothetical protein n=1 Tax=Streptomyces sp. NPDC056231 TaxID=3345755 RepID=UPI003AAC194D
MSDETRSDRNGPETAGVVSPDAPLLPAAPDRPGRTRRLIPAVLGAVLVIGSVGGAAAYTKITVDHADRGVKTTLWAKSSHKASKDPAGEVGRGRAITELSKLLLPVPSGYRLGPDIGESGNDSELSGRKATAALKESNRGLAGKERRALDRRVDQLHIQGVALRSYTSDNNDLLVDVQITRMKDKKAVRDLYTFRNGVFDSFGGFREGPTIDGHRRNATCFLSPRDSEDRIENIWCQAYDGELSIAVSAAGTKPIGRTAVAELLKDQLNHITSPGEYV